MAGQIEIEHHSECDNIRDHPDGKPFPMELEVLQSAAGYYLGTQCDFCGPYGRESEYFASYEEAEQALVQWEAGNKVQARTTEYRGAGGNNIEQWLTDQHLEEFKHNQPGYHETH